ncbi:MAG: hypothetical protein ACJAYG_000210 [Oceanicoccus sp.]|jgi:hypothetical protein
MLFLKPGFCWAFLWMVVGGGLLGQVINQGRRGRAANLT